MELDLLGPRIEFLTGVQGSADEFCLLRGTLPPGAMIPLHSHPDREVFLILSGAVEIYTGGGWKSGSVDDVFDIAGDRRHALRNTSGTPAILVTVTTRSLAEFFQRVGRPLAEIQPGPPSFEAISSFNRAALESGYWLGSPEENAAIGLSLG